MTSCALVVVDWQSLTPVVDGSGAAVTFASVADARASAFRRPSPWSVVGVPVESLHDVRGWLLAWVADAPARFVTEVARRAARTEDLESVRG